MLLILGLLVHKYYGVPVSAMSNVWFHLKWNYSEKSFLKPIYIWFCCGTRNADSETLDIGA